VQDILKYFSALLSNSLHLVMVMSPINSVSFVISVLQCGIVLFLCFKQKTVSNSMPFEKKIVTWCHYHIVTCTMSRHRSSGGASSEAGVHLFVPYS